MAPVEHRADVVVLVDQLVLLQHRVDPARDGGARFLHHRLRGEAALDPVVIDAPHRGIVLPRTGGQAVVARQRIGVRADIGGALHIVVTTEDVGAAARLADIAQRQLHDARRAHDGVADGVLGLAHAPHQRARAVHRHHLGDLAHLRLGHATHFFDLIRRPLGEHFVAHLVHAVDAVVDERLVFPAVLEDVVQHAEQESDIGARADAHVLIGLGRRARVARVDHDHLAAGLLGMQQVQHRHRVRLRRVRADIQRAPGVLHVVVRVGHRAVAPGVRHTRHGGGVADARLVVAIVGAEERHPLAQQVSLFVAVLGRADEEERVRPGLLADRLHLLNDLAQCLLPADALVAAVHQLHRRLQAVFAVAVLAQRGALGAVRAQVDGRIEHRLLAHPHAVLHHCIHRAAHRAMRAHRAAHDDVVLALGRPRLAHRRLLHQRQLRRRQPRAHADAGALEEGPPVHGRQRTGQAARQAAGQGCGAGAAGLSGVGILRRRFAGQKHGVT